AVGRGDGLAARTHLPDEGRPRRPRGDDRSVRASLRRLPRLHGVRDGMSVGRSVLAAHRGDTRSDRTALRALVSGSPLPPRDLLDLSVSEQAAPRARAARALVLGRWTFVVGPC